MSKYEPLPQFLTSRRADSVRLGFGEIERVLGFKLPKSAYDHEAWWSNNASAIPMLAPGSTPAGAPKAWIWSGERSPSSA